LLSAEIIGDYYDKADPSQSATLTALPKGRAKWGAVNERTIKKRLIQRMLANHHRKAAGTLYQSPTTLYSTFRRIARPNF
jgi:hypothetical protein